MHTHLSPWQVPGSWHLFFSPGQEGGRKSRLIALSAVQALLRAFPQCGFLLQWFTVTWGSFESIFFPLEVMENTAMSAFGPQGLLQPGLLHTQTLQDPGLSPAGGESPRGNQHTALGLGPCRFDPKDKWQGAGPQGPYQGWWWKLGQKVLPDHTEALQAHNCFFQKEPQEYLGKHRKRYEMSHAFPAGVDQQGEAKGPQASRQPQLRLVQVLLLVVGPHGHLLCPPRHGACIPLARGAV